MKPDAAYHGLFLPEDGLNPDFEAEPIAKIFVTRYEHGGKMRVPRHFAPEELRELADVFQRFGGGTYELEARRADGTVYAKRMHTLPGEAKALVDPSAAGASSHVGTVAAAPPAVTHTDPTLAMMQMMMASQQENSRMMMGMFQVLGTVLAAAVAGGKHDGKESSPAEMIAAMAQLTTATRAPPPPPPTALSEVLAVQDAIEKVAERRTEAAQAAAKALAPPPDEESIGDTLKGIVEAAGPLVMSLASAAPKVLPPA